MDRYEQSTTHEEDAVTPAVHELQQPVVCLLVCLRVVCLCLPLSVSVCLSVCLVVCLFVCLFVLSSCCLFFLYFFSFFCCCLLHLLFVCVTCSCLRNACSSNEFHTKHTQSTNKSRTIESSKQAAATKSSNT